MLPGWGNVERGHPVLLGARVVNVSNGSGSVGEARDAGGTPAYAVSKAALDMLTADLRRRGVTSRPTARPARSREGRPVP